MKRVTNDPWAPIDRSTEVAAVSARRVDGSPWDFYWARDALGRRMLLLSFRRAARPAGQLPSLKEIEVALRAGGDGGLLQLTLTLVDASSRDMFTTLCNDIISGTLEAQTEAQAAATALSRTWRWHHFLRGAQSGELSEANQLGLLGELEVLRGLVLPALGGIPAVRCWRGPLGAPKDFESGGYAIEVKTRRSGSQQTVTISSSDQLDSAHLAGMSLAVVVASVGSSSDPSLSSYVAELRGELANAYPQALMSFEARLEAAGFDDQADYSAWRWSIEEVEFFEVRDSFPRLSTGSVPRGVSRVSYSLDLAAVEGFRISAQSVATLLKESR